MTINYSKLRLAAVLYGILPIIIFFIGWIKLAWTLIFSVLLILAVFFMIKNTNDNDAEYKSMTIPVKNVVLIGIIALVWCLIAGQGDFMHQSTDHIIRDAIFRDLVRRPWPVIYSNDQMLSYYIAHWMPPAAIGKLVFTITGSTFAGYLSGNIAMLIWSSIGVFITLMLLVMITARGNKLHPFIAVFGFILFSGLDIIGSFMTGNYNPTHLEWWRGLAQFSSVTTCLFWVYNQTIVSWMMTLCLINEKKPENFALLGFIIFPYGPFPFIGTVILCLVKAAVIFSESIKSKTFKDTLIKDTLTLQNILGTAAIAPVHMLYFTANAIISNNAYYDNVKVNTGFRFHEEILDSNVFLSIMGMLLFFLIEAGCFLLVIFFNDIKKKHFNKVLYICSVLLMFVPLFQVGKSKDFGMRVSIPLMLFICIEFIRTVMENLPEKKEITSLDSFIRTKPILAAAVLVFALGTATPITEYVREVTATITAGIDLNAEYYFQESLEYWDEINNFAAIGYEDSAYYKIFSKK